MTLNELEVKIRDWAIERNIDKSENAPKQMIKIMEELGETSAALLKKNEPELKDGIGDILVTVIIFAQQLGYTPAECLEAAWNEIKDRKGETKDGVFVKDE
jgi:NTP pyrophosphatase (non-canonical NTP hydrolase)